MSTRRIVLGIIVCVTQCLLVVTSSDSNDTHSTLPDINSQSTTNSLQQRRRCQPVPHDVLWQRLQISSVIADANDEDDDVLNSTQSAVNTSIPDNENSSDRAKRSVWNNSRRRGGRRRHRGRHGVTDTSSPSNEFRRSSWHCRLEKRWKRMPPGVFPNYIQTGTCRRQSTCVMGIFECRPRRYRINLLRRVAAADCRPLANTGPSTHYEETWQLVERKVIVGCECSRKRATGSYRRPENG